MRGCGRCQARCFMARRGYPMLAEDASRRSLSVSRRVPARGRGPVRTNRTVFRRPYLPGPNAAIPFMRKPVASRPTLASWLCVRAVAARGVTSRRRGAVLCDAASAIRNATRSVDSGAVSCTSISHSDDRQGTISSPGARPPSPPDSHVHRDSRREQCWFPLACKKGIR
jgi:hypothetical protein